MKKNCTFFGILLLILTVFSCATNPYKTTEKSYTHQLNDFKKTMSNKTPILLVTDKNTILPEESETPVDPINFYKDTLSIKSPKTLDNGIQTEWISSVNFNLRKPNFVIIHHTAQDSLAQTIKTFTLTKTQVSSHYVIADDGKVVQMVNDYLRAWHGGAASWGKNTDINSCSIGIELDNNGKEHFSQKQIISLVALLAKLKKDYNIPTQNFIGHSDIAPSRKTDPSIYFPWKTLSENGFGLWPDEVLETAPKDFNCEMALKIIGYNTKNLAGAIGAFKHHFMKIEADEILDEVTRNTIYSIFKKQ
jgi:N-acetylmuramoyl-L-alanine amidase